MFLTDDVSVLLLGGLLDDSTVGLPLSALLLGVDGLPFDEDVVLFDEGVPFSAEGKVFSVKVALCSAAE